jgi:twitching motility protein PilJ
MLSRLFGVGQRYRVEVEKQGKQEPRTMKLIRKRKGSTGGGDRSLIFIIVLLLASVIAMGAIYAYVAIYDGYDKQYITLLGEERVLSQQITKFAGLAQTGNPNAFEELAKHHDRFGFSLQLLRAGDPETGMPPSPSEVSKQLGQVVKTWEKFTGDAQVIIDSRAVVVALQETVKHINNNAPALVALSDEVATLMARKRASPQQVYLASRQLLLVQRIIHNVNLVLEGGEEAVTAADRFGRDAALYGRVLQGFLDGDPGMNVAKVNDGEIVAQLEELSELFDMVGKQVGGILERSPEVFQVSEAVSEVINTSGLLLTSLADLEKAYREYLENRSVSALMGNLFGIVALMLLIYLGLRLRQDAEQRVRATEGQRQETEDQNLRNQQAIMRLLDEMGDLADGDLTVHATVTEDVTGAIADSINYAIDALRNLVTAINDTTGKVTSAAQNTRATAKHLAEASEHQAQQIASATTAVNEMAISIEGVSKNAGQLSDESRRSVDIAIKGTEAVQKTIDGMDTIRDQIQETSKRIKRLGESSQEIGDIVELINDIAEQTNILALNAAIQAAMAGEAGRGFAVVADEVQRLAERSGDATRQIEALVKTIQTDTNEAVISMEQSTSGVVAGARLAEGAGTALGEIENVATHLSELVQSISSATQNQAAAASKITDTMNVIQEITTQTSEGTDQTSNSIGDLANLANELKESVAGFKLPSA